jgi:hypothetical protein
MVLGLIMGAVAMKMMSNTSITSMKGTMLISLMVRLARPRVDTDDTDCGSLSMRLVHAIGR